MYLLRAREKINAEFWQWRRNSNKEREALILVVLRRRVMPIELMHLLSKPVVVFFRVLRVNCLEPLGRMGRRPRFR